MTIDGSGNLLGSASQVVLEDYSLQFFMDLYVNADQNDDLFIYILVKNAIVKTHIEATQQLQYVKALLELQYNS